LKGGQVFGQGRKQDMLTDNKLSAALDCEVTLKKSGGRFWVTGCRPQTNQKAEFAN